MDLFGDFEKFKAINKEREINCSIGDKCVTSYMSSLDKCQDNNNIEFCKILYVFYKYYNEQARNIKHCKNVEKYLPPVSEYFNPLQYEGTADTYEEAPKIGYCNNVQKYLPPVKGYLNAVSYAVIAVFTIPILSSIVFLLYKFTPLQSWIRPQIVERKKLLKNLQEETFKLQENYKINESGTRNNGFNLAYNAVHN
ncbi:PIR protein [Plasmodium vivax]|uniref:VIR protein n=1 Tax=Plasmodium vivax TaxID=5855 RepID=A0A565A4J0_PLAVI|nr:PIR protein [Plasmodium vivax]